jgi:hypothetical protein
VCACFAVATVTISGLDLMNVRPLKSAAEFVHAHHATRMAEWPGLIRSGIRQILFSGPTSVTVAIPSEFAMTPLPARPFAGAGNNEAPVAGLAAARHQDAVELAMDQPATLAKATTADLAQHAQDLLQKSREQLATGAPPPAEPATMQLASGISCTQFGCT